MQAPRDHRAVADAWPTLRSPLVVHFKAGSLDLKSVLSWHNENSSVIRSICYPGIPRGWRELGFGYWVCLLPRVQVVERATPSSLFSKNCWLFKHSESKTKFHTVIQANILSCSCDQNQCICKPNAAKYILFDYFFDNIIESKYHLVGGVQFILNKCLSSQPIIPVWLKIKLWNPPTNQALLCNTMMVEVPTGEYHLDDRRHPKNSSGKASPDPMLRETYCNNLYNYWQIIGSQSMHASSKTLMLPKCWFMQNKNRSSRLIHLISTKHSQISFNREAKKRVQQRSEETRSTKNAIIWIKCGEFWNVQTYLYHLITCVGESALLCLLGLSAISDILLGWLSISISIYLPSYLSIPYPQFPSCIYIAGQIHGFHGKHMFEGKIPIYPSKATSFAW